MVKMLPITFIRCFLLVLLFASCVLISYGKGGRGGGGSRGGGRSSGGGWGSSSSSSSSSSSRSSSSSSKSSSSGKSDYSYGTSLGSGGTQSANYPRQQYYQKPSAPSATSLTQGIPNANYPRQPISSNSFTSSHRSYDMDSLLNANYPKQPITFNPFISSQSLSSQGGISNANFPRQTISSNHFSSNPLFPSHSSFPKVGIQNANYPRQPISSNPFSSNPFLPSHSSVRQGDILNANYPRQPISTNLFSSNPLPSHSSFPKVGIQNVNYPRQPISANPAIPFQSSSSQGIIPNSNYPRQTPKTFGSSHSQGLPTVNFPRQAIPPNRAIPRERSTFKVQPSRSSSLYNRPPNGFPNTNYPRQPDLPTQILGSGVWNPKSGMSAPVYMNYGGLPTGSNMYTKPLKKKGFLGSLISLGSSGKSYKNKHYGSYPSPYGMGGGRPSDVLGSFMGNKGSKTAMYTILPYMAARKPPIIFKPKFRFYNYRPVLYHSHGYHPQLSDTEYANMRYDVYDKYYVGKCNRPIKPDHARIVCNSTHNQVYCGITCDKGYRYSDNTTTKTNMCWHAAGVWNPAKNFPDCKPVCNETCLNGGTCARPGVCGCPSEYRGPRCEFHFLNCDIRKFTKGLEIRWVCSHTNNETSCRVKCKSPPEFATPSQYLYKCTPEGVWTPSSMPLCDSEASTTVGETLENSTLVPQVKAIKATERKVSGVF